MIASYIWGQAMHFVVIIPFWLAIILWVIKIVGAVAKEDSKVTVVQRMITAPDGRQATFVVPVDEPASVSIGRMYPDGIVQYPQASVKRMITLEAPLCSPLIPNDFIVFKVIGGCIGLIAIAMIFAGMSDHSYKKAKDDFPDRLSPSYVLPAQVTVTASPVIADPSPATTAVTTPTSHIPPVSLEHVRLKTRSNIRVSGSRAGAVIRVIGQGTVLAKFGEANGWTQVGVLGSDSPEGWVANSTIMPAAP